MAVADRDQSNAAVDKPLERLCENLMPFKCNEPCVILVGDIHTGFPLLNHTIIY